MQNRYVGDIGDFAKYALLRRLAGARGKNRLRLGVIWCLYPDESHNGDGRHISYLGHPEFLGLDEELRATLRPIVESGHRSISAVVDAGILPRGTIFFDAPVCVPKGIPSKRADRLSHRSKWLKSCFRFTKTRDLVFFDPDNGVEVPSIAKYDAKGGKYIYWDELTPFWKRGQALLIYHHLNRTRPAAEQIGKLMNQMRLNFEGASARPLVFRRGSCRVFWLVYRPNTTVGQELEHQSDKFLADGWAKHFRPFG